MNWRRGLVRIWVCLSVIWSLIFGWMAFYSHMVSPPEAFARADLPFELPVILLPWLLSAAVLGILWIIHGFRSPSGHGLR